MPSSKNIFIVASAGSRKTTLLVERALAIAKGRVLITTYTNENVEQIVSYLVRENGCVPSNVTVMSWYRFLLQEGVRPYQNHISRRGRVHSILFVPLPAMAQFARKNDVENYFFTGGDNIYVDRTADFVCRCDEKSESLIIKRLERVFAHIFIDEFQDFAGYDLDVVGKLLSSSISVVAACDPRQATFSTNRSPRNRQFRGSAIADWIAKQSKLGLLSIERQTECYRSNQIICDFADALYPDYPKTLSRNEEVTGHDGVFSIPIGEVSDYVQKHNPIVLRYNVNAQTINLRAINIGLSKGRTYDRVLVFPTKSMIDYYKSKDISKAGDVAKLYVAVTRARYSVAFVI